MTDHDPIRNPSSERPLSDIIAERYSRRDILGAAGKLGLLAMAATALRPQALFAQDAAGATALTPAASSTGLAFTEVAKNSSINHTLAPGYELQLLIRWGDRLQPGAPGFDPSAQSAAAQLQQFGYNNDFLAYLPFPPESGSSFGGLLCANHEYSLAHLMFPGLTEKDSKDKVTQEQVDVEMAAHGHSVVEIRRENNHWQPVVGSPYNRRISALETKMAVGGPAKGHARLRTSEDPKGETIIGTFGNCAGGVTPWQTVLVSEENFDNYFAGSTPDAREARNHDRYGLGDHLYYGWHRFYKRFNVDQEPHEPNRYGWVVEYDPYDPKRQPVKRTALGRFKHETATTALAPDGRVVVYSGDDQVNEYIYRFVSTGKYDAKKREANFGLLDSGTLSVAKFHVNGELEWLPLVFGQNGLTPENGFNDQGDVLIEARRAGDIVGATPMDRPEGIAVVPQSGKVFVSLTNNKSRKPEAVNAANTRAKNIHGHIIEFLPPAGDHAAAKFQWKIFLQGGNPSVPADGAVYPSPVSEHGWLSCPDNLAVDPTGHLWIATDGQPKSIGLNDGLYAAATEGEGYGASKLFFSGPLGCEVTGPCFTPDGQTVFVSIQHPGDTDGATYEQPSTRWPDFRDGMPPRPSVVAITKTGGGRIGS